MNFWSALVLIISVILGTSLIYNIAKNIHTEKMFRMELEKLRIEHTKYKEAKTKKVEK